MKRLQCLVLLSILALPACSSTLRSAYNPVSPPLYSEEFSSSAAVGQVTDERQMDPTEFWVNPEQIFDKAYYDRTVADVVREALQTEFKRAGLSPAQGESTASPEPATELRCRVLEFSARGVDRLFASGSIELAVVLGFQWIDPRTGSVVLESGRSEKRQVELGWGDSVPVMPFDSSQIESYGTQLVNDLLPRAIEKEIRSNGMLQGQDS